MVRRVILAFGLLAFVAVSLPAWADDAPRLIKVTGNGESTAAPDIAIMSIGVETEAKTPSGALSDNASRMNAVMAKLKEVGIAEKDLRTSQLGIWPIYADRSSNAYRPEPKGYRVSNQLTVTLRDVERIGEILDQAVADGANKVNGPSFSVAEPEPHYQAARDAAVADAIAKAERYAAAAGVTLGSVTRIDETGSGGGPVFARQMRAEAMAAPTPVAAGETTFSAGVTMVFAIE